MSIRSTWEGWCGRYAALSKRERAITAAAAVFGVAMIGSTLFIEPQFAKVSLSRKNVEQQTADMAKFEGQWNTLQERMKQDPDLPTRKELEALSAKLRVTNEALTAANSAMIPPAEMNGLLERILARQRGLQLVSLRTLPVTPFQERKGTGSDKPEKSEKSEKTDKAESPEKRFDIYRHGVEIKMTGTYGDLHSYLVQLERERQKMLWGEVRLKVIDHPKAEMTLTVYTLGLDKTWLAI